MTAQVSFTGPKGSGVFSGQQLTLVGRASPGGPVDDLTLTAGRWARRAGEIVWPGSGHGPPVTVGSQVTISGVPGSPPPPGCPG